MRIFSKIVVVMAALALAGAGWVAASGEDAKPAKPAEKPAAEKKADPQCDPKTIEKAKAAAARSKDGKKAPAPVCKPADSKESFFTLEDIYAGKLETAGRTEKPDEEDTVTWRKVDDKKTKKKNDN